MKSSRILSIPEPCHESWAAMSPTMAGRHCAACQKTVIDFTLKTDAEILAYLAGATLGRTCGRFYRQQLDRPLQPLAIPVPNRWRAWLAAAVAIWGVREVASPAAGAQTASAQHRTAEGEKKLIKPRHQSYAAETRISGVVRDAAT